MSQNEQTQHATPDDELLEQVSSSGDDRVVAYNQYRRETRILRALCIKAYGTGISEAKIARTAQISVTALRAWLGKPTATDQLSDEELKAASRAL